VLKILIFLNFVLKFTENEKFLAVGLCIFESKFSNE